MTRTAPRAISLENHKKIGRLMLCNRVLFRFKQNFQNFQHKWSYDKMLID